MTFRPSKYQQAIFDFITGGTGSALVEAVAGSGKTTTVVQGLEFIPSHLSTTFLAFNKSIAVELASRLPRHVRAKTYHGLGMGAVLKWAERTNGKRPGNDYVDEYKLIKIARRLMAADAFDNYGKAAIQLVGMAKQWGVGTHLEPLTPEVFHRIREHFGVEFEGRDAIPERGVEYAMQLLIESNRQANLSIDFDDMIYLPVLFDLRLWQNDWLIVDEAQDTNPVQLELLRKSLKRNGRLIAVGDTRQAIYGFRGADANAMKNIKDAFHCVELPLSICYRCSRSVVEHAKRIVPHIESFDGALAGHVDTLGVWSTSVFNGPDDGVVCRNTAPLIELAFSMMRDHVAFSIMGKDIGDGLITLINKLEATDLEELDVFLDVYYEDAKKKYDKPEDGAKLAAVDDKVTALKAMIENMYGQGIRDLLQTIEMLFNGDGGGVTLCTAHKAKGLEWKRVFILDPFLMPSKHATKAWEIEQEANLQYVAITRAKHELYYIRNKDKVEA